MSVETVPVAQLPQVIAPSLLLGAVSGFVAVLVGRLNGALECIRTISAIPDNDAVRLYVQRARSRTQISDNSRLRLTV